MRGPSQVFPSVNFLALLALLEKACPEREPKGGRGTADIVRPRFARQERVRPVAALSPADFFITFNSDRRHRHANRHARK